MEQYLKVGVIVSPHGIKGEVKVFPTTDDPLRFRKLKEVMIRKGVESKTYRIQGAKFFKKFVILKLEGLEDMDTAEMFRKAELFISREQAVPLKQDEYYMADLIDMQVFTEDGIVLGTLKDILQTGANDVYCIQSEVYGEVLIPAIKDCIIKIDTDLGRMTVHLLPGLIDQKKGIEK